MSQQLMESITQKQISKEPLTQEEMEFIQKMVKPKEETTVENSNGLTKRTQRILSWSMVAQALGIKLAAKATPIVADGVIIGEAAAKATKAGIIAGAAEAKRSWKERMAR